MIELTLRWFDLAAIGVALTMWTFAAVLTGAWIDKDIQLRRDRRQRREERSLHGTDSLDCWLQTAEPTRTNGWSSLAPEEGEAA